MLLQAGAGKLRLTVVGVDQVALEGVAVVGGIRARGTRHHGGHDRNGDVVCSLGKLQARVWGVVGVASSNGQLGFGGRMARR